MSFDLLQLLNPNLRVLSEAEPEQLPDGQLAVLSVGRGDMKVDFNSDNPEEVEEARTVVMDMLSRGYLIFINVDGEQVRVHDFDPKTDEYIIKIDKRTRLWKNRDKDEEPEEPRKPSKQRVSAKKSSGTSFAPTGGG